MEEGTRATMQDVADRAGVSRMTVSRALRNEPGIAPATRERVVLAARDLDYRVNPLVSALMADLRGVRKPDHAETLAFLTSPTSSRGAPPSFFVRRCLEGAAKRARETGFRVEEFRLRDTRGSGRRLSDILWHRRIRGLLIAPTSEGRAGLDLDWDRFAAVAIGHSLRHPGLHRVSNRQTRSMRLLLDELSALGFRRVGLVMNRLHNERVDRAWSMAFFDYQSALPSRRRIPPLCPERLTENEFKEWVLRHRPDAVVATHKKHIVPWLRELGLAVPDDIGYATVNRDDPGSAHSGIDQNPELIGEAAVEFLAERLYHNQLGLPTNPKILFVEGKWIPGQTVRTGTSAAAG